MVYFSHPFKGLIYRKQKLDLSKNKITELKLGGSCPGLADLDLSSNLLKGIKEFANFFPELTILNISNNRIESLYELKEIEEMDFLAELFFSNNPGHYKEYSLSSNIFDFWGQV
jgi:Leucine Rich repeats (2 copies)